MATSEFEMTRQRLAMYEGMMNAVEKVIIAVTVFSFGLILYIMTTLMDVVYY